jgi:hypothetical protein
MIDAAYTAAAGSTGKSDTEHRVGRVCRFATRKIEVPISCKGGKDV